MADDPPRKDRPEPDPTADTSAHPEPPHQVRDPRSYRASGAYKEEGGKGGGDDDQGGDDKKNGDDSKKNDGDKNGKSKKKSFFKRPIVLIIAAVVIVALIVGLILFWLHARNWQSTDDAFVDAHIVHVAPQIAGRISAVPANDNELVQPGQLLAQIDPIDVDQHVSQVQAQRAQAVAQREQATAQREQALAQIKVSRRQYEQAAAQIPGAEAQARAAANDYARYSGLKQVNPQAVANQQLDQSRAQATQTASQAAASRRAAAAADAQVRQAETQVAAADAQIRAAGAQIAQADAQLANAQTQQGYSQIRSPVKGHVSRRTVAVGNYVQPGQELMAITPTNLWITANFKETQLKLMRPGQYVKIKVDAYPQIDFHGHVDSIQRGAGQAFAILPSENATGNFVKVVQRVPVKIVIDNLDDANHPLGPGMSVEPSVKVRP